MSIQYIFQPMETVTELEPENEPDVEQEPSEMEQMEEQEQQTVPLEEPVTELAEQPRVVAPLVMSSEQLPMNLEVQSMYKLLFRILVRVLIPFSYHNISLLISL